MDPLKFEYPSVEEFKKIANKLFHEYAIETSNGIFRILDIEFYWNSSTHKDNSTYKRKHVDPKNGEWFFHYSGVDIALKEENGDGYGGILIRSIFDIESEKIYKGPMVCAMRLFSGTNAFNDTIKTKIIPWNFPESKISNGPKIGLGKNALEHDAYKLEYRFLINPKII